MPLGHPHTPQEQAALTRFILRLRLILLSIALLLARDSGEETEARARTIQDLMAEMEALQAQLDALPDPDDADPGTPKFPALPKGMMAAAWAYWVHRINWGMRIRRAIQVWKQARAAASGRAALVTLSQPLARPPPNPNAKNSPSPPSTNTPNSFRYNNIHP